MTLAARLLVVDTHSEVLLTEEYLYGFVVVNLLLLCMTMVYGNPLGSTATVYVTCTLLASSFCYYYFAPGMRSGSTVIVSMALLPLLLYLLPRTFTIGEGMVMSQILAWLATNQTCEIPGYGCYCKH